MPHYTVTHTCGHEERVNLIGKPDYRDWRVRRLEEEDCFACRKASELQAAKQVAAEYDLPPLHGSEKQIEWAETIRVQKLDELDAERPRLTELHDASLLEAADALMQETSAHRWIEWRTESLMHILKEIRASRAQPARTVSDAQRTRDALQQTVLAQATVRPETPVTEAVAEISLHGSEIAVQFPEKREDFRELVRFQLGYSWMNERWQRAIASHNGTVEDRAVELGHRLLAAGFPVRIFDEAIRAKAVSGDYEPECTRWILKRIAGEYAGWFALTWGRQEDFYVAAKRLKQSRYAKPDVVVPPEQWEEVLDFARMYDFRVGESAQALATQAKALREQMLTIQVAPVPRQRRTEAPPEKPVPLAVPDDIEVLEEFREEVEET